MNILILQTSGVQYCCSRFALSEMNNETIYTLQLPECDMIATHSQMHCTNTSTHNTTQSFDQSS